MVGDTVKHWREQRALTQTALARQIGRSKSYICELEHNTFSPSLESFLDIAAALAIEPCALLPHAVPLTLAGDQAYVSLQQQVSDLRRDFHAMCVHVGHPPKAPRGA